MLRKKEKIVKKAKKLFYSKANATNILKIVSLIDELKKDENKKMLSKLKNISIIILNLLSVFLTIGFFWALFWVLCAISDTCYYNNIGAF